MTTDKTRRHLIQLAIGTTLFVAADGLLSQSRGGVNSGNNPNYNPGNDDFNNQSNPGDEDIDPESNVSLKKHETKLPQLGPFHVEGPIKLTYDPYGGPYTFGRLYHPANVNTPLPILVFIHGGGWKMPTRLDYCDTLSRDIASCGVAVWNIEYRRVGGGGGWPITFYDVLHAIDYLPFIRDNVLHNIDLGNIYLTGHSSGGHLAALAAARADLTTILPGITINPEMHTAGLVTLAGVFDLPRALGRGKDRYLEGFFHGKPGESPELHNAYLTASPSYHLPLGAKILSFHGDQDNVVSIDQSISYVRQARKFGLNARLIPLTGTGHSAMVLRNSESWDYVRHQMVSFIRGAHL